MADQHLGDAVADVHHVLQLVERQLDLVPRVVDVADPVEGGEPLFPGEGDLDRE